ncbi:MAG: nodulation protein NodJ, partial [Ramlibacter sp.]
MAPHHWRMPELSTRAWPVFQRNLLVWRKLAIPSLLANIAEPLMWLLAFGYGMGALVGQVQLQGERVPYIVFLASGSICMSAMNAASFEALYSAFSRMHVQKTWDGIMNAPIRLDDVVLAEVLWAAFKAIFTALAKGYDFFAYYFTLFLTPMMFLSGVFFPREQLPAVLRAASEWLP